MSVCIPAPVSDSADDSKTCCTTCKGCTIALKRVQFFRDRQIRGNYQYVLYNKFTPYSYGRISLWSHKVQCKIFAELNKHPKLDAITRSDPFLLAYVDLYAPKDFKTLTSEDPKFMSFYEWDGVESIDTKQVIANMNYHIEQNRVCQARINAEKNRTMLSDAKQLASSLAANIADTDSSVMAQRLIQLLNSMVI